MKLKIFAAAALIAAALATAACAADIDYQEFQEDPLETAIRKLAVPDGAAWDKEVMLSGGAPDIVQEIIWPLRDGYLGRGVKRTGRRHDGVDMSAPRGTPIYAVLDGIVEVVSNNGPGFRGCMDALMPGWRERRRELGKYGALLLQEGDLSLQVE